jgi:O-antigen chain-terminating methyltransferase
LVSRLERERLEADRRYNDALTALDRALPARVELPAPPSPSANEMRDAMAALLDVTRRQTDALETFHSRLIQYLQQITPFIDTKQRAMGGTELRDQIGIVNERTLALKREMERLASAPVGSAGAASASGAAPPQTHGHRDAFKYLGFEDRFRGSRDEIRARLHSYVPLFSGAQDVLDVGCGRGELLELFREAGIRARGVDANERMASVCRERGLTVEQGDALEYVRAQPDESLGGLVAIQVVEHLPPDYLMAFLEAAYHALRPGAAIVLETINTSCWMAFFETYLRDLTHARPLHPDTLRFLVEASGFTRVEVTYREPVREADRLPRVPNHDPALTVVVNALNAHADQLNARLFSSMDYAVIARR